MKLTWIIASAAALLVSCGDRERIAGNGGDIGNGIVAGRVVQPDGRAAIHASVECAPEDRPPWEAQQPGWRVETDSSGRFVCTDLPDGQIGVSSFDPSNGLTAWRLDTSGSSSAALRVDTLARPGALRIALPPGTNGTLFLSGLNQRLAVNGENEVEFQAVPAGWNGAVYLALSTSDIVKLYTGILVAPGATDSAGYGSGTTTLRVPLAGSLTSALRAFPVLVRLDSTWAGFSSTLADGSDLRLRTVGGASLPLTIASWDKAHRRGSFWAFFDSIPVPGDSVDMVVDYGLPVARTNPGGAFSSAGGWTAVWPLGDTGSVVRERLGRFPGAAQALASTSGIAGNASRFDGKTSLVAIPGSSGGKLALPNGGPYTMSCWARLRTYTSSRFVMGYGALNTGLKYQGNNSSNANSWLIQDFRDTPMGVNFTYGHADTAVWTFVAATVEGDSVKLYIDGIRQSAALQFDGSTVPRSTVDFAIGASLDSLGTPSYALPGDLSEVWVHSLARSPDWIRFAAFNQEPSAPPVQIEP